MTVITTVAIAIAIAIASCLPVYTSRMITNHVLSSWPILVCSCICVETNNLKPWRLAILYLYLLSLSLAAFAPSLSPIALSLSLSPISLSPSYVNYVENNFYLSFLSILLYSFLLYLSVYHETLYCTLRHRTHNTSADPRPSSWNLPLCSQHWPTLYRITLPHIRLFFNLTLPSSLHLSLPPFLPLSLSLPSPPSLRTPLLSLHVFLLPSLHPFPPSPLLYSSPIYCPLSPS